MRGFAFASVTMATLSPRSPSDGSGPDVRRRLHGSRRLSAHLPDHRQLPPVPPTQTLALRITLHEHAQRRECSVPAFIRGHPSIHRDHLYRRLPPRQFPWATGAGTEELVNQIKCAFVTVALRLISSDKGVDAMRWPESASLKRQFTRDSKLVLYGLDKYSLVQLQGNGTLNMGPVKWDFLTFAKIHLWRFNSFLVILKCLIRHSYNKWAT